MFKYTVYNVCKYACAGEDEDGHKLQSKALSYSLCPSPARSPSTQHA